MEEAQKEQAALFSSLAQQDLAQKTAEVTQRVLQKMDQIIAFWDSACAESNAKIAEVVRLKELFQSEPRSDATEWEAKLALLSQKDASLTLQEKDDEISRMKKQMAELEERNRQYARELKEKNEQIEELKLLEIEEINWAEEIEKEVEEGKPIYDQIQEFLYAAIMNGKDSSAIMRCIDKLCKVEGRIADKEDMIKVLLQFGFKHSTQRGATTTT